MFKTLSNFATGVTKVAVGAVVAPVALVVDVITLPSSATDLDQNRNAFDNTARVFGLIGDGIKDSVKGEQK